MYGRQDKRGRLRKSGVKNEGVSVGNLDRSISPRGEEMPISLFPTSQISGHTT